jgi:phosphoribulokinase
MSVKHPIVATTGLQAPAPPGDAQQIFRRERVDAAFIEGETASTATTALR